MSENFSTFKERLKENSNIVTVVSKYIKLDKRGKTWWANCPFHFEKTPSFAVNEIDQYYNCFGCGASGDVIGFVEKIESVDFMEALEILAKDAGMQMPTFAGNENIAKLKKEKEVAYEILKEAARFYVASLRNPTSVSGHNYIKRRNLLPETLNAFGIGYSPGWTQVVDHLVSKGYTPAQIKSAGVADERDGNYVDAYAKRLIFPVINSNNDVIGFSARLLEDADFAKYKNTSQTIVFDKSRVLYGINNVKKLKQTQGLNEIVIVEGQMDLISLYQQGIRNLVATMGTSLTNMHAKELKRYCDKVIICFDGDGAGKKAALRSIEILNAGGLEVYVASLPAGVDPDDFINKFGKAEFEKLIAQAKYWVEYLIRDFEGMYDLNKLNEKSDFIINALNVVKKLESESEQNVYLELIKKITNMSIDVLRQDLKSLDSAKMQSNKTMDDDANLDLPKKENAYVKAVKFVLASLLHKKEYATLAVGIKDNFLNPDYIKIYDYIETCMQNGKKPIISTLFDMFDVESSEDIKSVINYEFNDELDNEQYYLDCVKNIKLTGLYNLQNELTEKITQIKDLDERRAVAKKLNEVILEIRNVNKK